MSQSITKGENILSPNKTGIIYTFTCIFLLFCMTILVKHIPNVSSFMVNFIRQLSGFFYAYTCIVFTENKFLGTHSTELWAIIFRGLLSGVGTNCFWASIQSMPLTITLTVYYTNCVLVMVLSAIFLNERLTILKYLAGVMAYVGVVIVIFSGYSNESEVQKSTMQETVGIVLALVAGICIACTNIIVRKYAKTVGIMQFFASFCFFGEWSSAIGFAYSGQEVVFPSLEEWLILAFFCIFSIPYQLLYHKALQLSSPSIVTIILQLEIALGFLADIFIFGLPFHFISLIGCIISVVSTLYVIAK